MGTREHSHVTDGKEGVLRGPNGHAAAHHSADHRGNPEVVAFNDWRGCWESYRLCQHCHDGVRDDEPCAECAGEGRTDIQEIDITEHQYRHEDFGADYVRQQGA